MPVIMDRLRPKGNSTRRILLAQGTADQGTPPLALHACHLVHLESEFVASFPFLLLPPGISLPLCAQNTDCSIVMHTKARYRCTGIMQCLNCFEYVSLAEIESFCLSTPHDRVTCGVPISLPSEAYRLLILYISWEATWLRRYTHSPSTKVRYSSTR